MGWVCCAWTWQACSTVACLCFSFFFFFFFFAPVAQSHPFPCLLLAAGLTQEGIYRKPASQASLEKLKTAFELGMRACVLFCACMSVPVQGEQRVISCSLPLAFSLLPFGFTTAGDLDLHEYFSPTPSTNHINTAASLLKLYLRSLPENILTDQLRPDLTAGWLCVCVSVCVCVCMYVCVCVCVSV